MHFGGGPNCKKCQKPVYFSEEVIIEGKVLHQACSHCTYCNRKLDAGNGRFRGGEFKCSACTRKEFESRPKMTNASGGVGDSPNACPKCGKNVYMAEEVRAVGKKFHKSCFTCIICNNRLDSTTLCNKDDGIYCKSCYAKEFGPKGYGYGQGAGALPFT